MVCSLTKASPTETQEIKFLTTLVGKVRQCPDLIHIFLDSCSPDTAVTPCSFDASREASGRTSRTGKELNMHNIERLAINVRAALDCLASRHTLAAALTNYIDSADYVLGLQAMEALLLVASLESDIAAEALVSGSSLLPSLLQRLEQLHTALPGDLDPSCLEEVEVSWAQVYRLLVSFVNCKSVDYICPILEVQCPVFVLQVHSTEEDSFPGRSEVVALLSFMDYLDNLCRCPVDSDDTITGLSNIFPSV